MSIVAGILVGMGSTAVSPIEQGTAPARLTPVREIAAHSGAVTELAWSPDGGILASASGDYTAEAADSLRLWSTAGDPLADQPQAAHTFSLDWSPDGSLLAAGSSDGRIALYDRDGELVREFGSESGAIMSLDWSPSGDRLAAGRLVSTSDNEAQIWTLDGDLLHRLPTDYSGGKFYYVGWSPDGRFLAAGATDYALWTADGELIFHCERCEFCTPAWGFGWSPDSTLWATGDESGFVMVFSIRVRSSPTWKTRAMSTRSPGRQMANCLPGVI
ncbi:MAG: hypothetical protein IPK19_04180 [Chloroflexi bacterium]|nr:hypothetical protein [Chloroflexota bacterium]